MGDNAMISTAQKLNHIKSLIKDHCADDLMYERVREFMIEQGIDDFMMLRNAVFTSVHQGAAEALINKNLDSQQLNVFEINLKRLSDYLCNISTKEINMSAGDFWDIDGFDTRNKKHYADLMKAALWVIPDFNVEMEVFDKKSLLQHACGNLLNKELAAIINGLIDWCGADINSLNSKDSKKPLHYLGIEQDTESFVDVLNMLISHGADVNERLHFNMELAGAAPRWAGGATGVGRANVFKSYMDYMDVAHAHYSHVTHDSTSTNAINAKANYSYFKKRLSAIQAFDSTSEHLSPSRSHRKTI